MQPEIEPQETLEEVSYRTVWMEIGAGFGALFLVIGLLLIPVVLFGDTDERLSGLIFLAAWLGLVAYSLWKSVLEVTTSQHSLRFKYFLRAPQDISYSDIRKLVIRSGRGQWCAIRYGDRLDKVVTFPVDYFAGRSAFFHLLDLIVHRARLTKTGTTFWGMPIYERMDSPLR